VTTKSNLTTNAGKLLAILMAMVAMQRYDAMCITQWSILRATLEATGCHHRASACAKLPWQLSRSSISKEAQKHIQ